MKSNLAGFSTTLYTREGGFRGFLQTLIPAGSARTGVPGFLRLSLRFIKDREIHC